ncbi:MAG: amidohydrolase family protein [Rhodospirillaceae bacterium]|nr:amidohydrolase family protein [Rhodospirillaceae bacterium]
MIRFAACVLGLLGAQPAFAQTVAITNVTLIDGTGAPPAADQTVLVRDGKIAAVGAEVAVPRGVVRIDGRGKFLIPGLFDAHIHVPGNGDRALGMTALHSFLYSGVTSVYDAGNNADYIMGLRADERAGRILAPRIFATGAGITYPKSWGAGLSATLVDAWPEDMAAVDANLARQPDLQKFTFENFGTGANAWVPSFSPELFTQVVQHVKSKGVRTTIHISDEAHARVAIAAGADTWAHPVAVGRMSAEFPKMVADSGTIVVTTLAVFDNIVRTVDDPSYLDTPLMRAVMEPAQIEDLKTRGRNQYLSIGWGSWFKTTLSFSQGNVKQLHDAGATLALGTDRALGPLVHREMELVAQSGIAPLDVITIATLNAARYVGREADLGSIEPGKWADLVLLDADPVADIANVARIARVFKGGIEVDRAKLQLPVNRK